MTTTESIPLVNEYRAYVEKSMNELLKSFEEHRSGYNGNPPCPDALLKRMRDSLEMFAHNQEENIGPGEHPSDLIAAWEFTLLNAFNDFKDCVKEMIEIECREYAREMEGA